MHRPRRFHTVHLQTLLSVVVIIVLWYIFMYFLWSKQKYFNINEIKFVTYSLVNFFLVFMTVLLWLQEQRYFNTV